MAEKRNFDTEFPYIIDTETGPEEGTIDLTKMSEEELLNLVPQLTEAMMELVYREIVPETDAQD